MKLYPLIILFLLCGIGSFAQNTNGVKGSVADTSSKVKLAGTTIAVLNAKDSIMRKFVYATDNGQFAINGLPGGNFILLVSYPAYADYVEKFTLDAAHPTHDFGPVNMQLKSKILSDVLIKGTVNAIKIKGDTTEFNAKAYVIQPNDKVEDLLKQLPGIQIDKDGKITANGQTINKVLVDGEEFFGDDPTLVTKNLRADMVDKVQLYDKKSDQAAFTGIDDGQKTKTINIKLKEDRKSGTFGKLNAGIATRDYYEGQAIFNRFKAKKKYSAYFTSGSDGKIGLGYNDNNTIGATGNSVQFGDDGSSFIVGGSGFDALDSFSGNYNGYGKPVAHSGGLHYDNKWSNDVQAINTNYKIGSLDVNGTTNTITQQNLTGVKAINTTSNQTNSNYGFRHKLDAAYTYKPDTITSVKISADGTFKNFRVNNDYATESVDQNGALLNTNNRSVTNNGDQQLFNASVFYTHKFKTYGRTFSWNVSENYNANQTKGFLHSKAIYYNDTTGAVIATKPIDQLKTTNTLSSITNSNMTYSEPLSKFAAVVFNYGLGFNNSTADRKSFNQSTPDNYTDLDQAFSNNYRFLQITNQVGAIFNYKKKKVTLNFGTKVSNVDFKQTDLFTSNVYKRSYVNWQPTASFQYRPSLQKAYSIYYSGYISQPTIDQIQPISSNTDPFNITIGNANLKPSFSHGISINYNSSKILSGTNTYLYGYVSARDNAIVNSSTTILTNTPTAKKGETTIQYVNLTGETPITYFGSASIGRKLKGSGISLNLGVNSNGNLNYSFINNALNKSESYTFGASVGASKYVAKKYSFSVNGGPSYTINKFSLQPVNNSNARGFSAYSNEMLFLPAKFSITTDINYTYNAATKVFPEQYRTIWNASLNKAFFKGENLKFAITATDMLNQNISFYRNVYANNITQTTNTSIGRYFLFSVTWDFTKFATEPTK